MEFTSFSVTSPGSVVAPAVTSEVKTRLRMAYLVSAYPATSHTFILREVLGLRTQGFEISTASINADSRPLDRLTQDEREERERTYVIKEDGIAGALKAHWWGISKHTLGYFSGLGAAWRRRTEGQPLWKHIAHFTEGLMIGRWMAQQHLTHLHVHFATAAASVATLTRQTLPITLSMTIHGPDEFANVRHESLAEKVAVADNIICISHFARGQAMQHSDPAHWHKMHVVRLGVDPSQYAQVPVRRLDSPWSLRLLCVGRLTPAKGQHLLLQALADLKARNRHDIHLTLVGDGPDAASLKAQTEELGLQKQVVFKGALNQDEVHQQYRECDAFVLPSFAEGIPVVLMEAMACGLPCLSTRVAGIPELIEDGTSGLLVSPSDVAALAARILVLAHHPELRQRLGTEGRHRVLHQYNLPHNINELGRVFREQLQRKQS
jgi:glycosyltransferase involved in cell wall biosynthesis